MELRFVGVVLALRQLVMEVPIGRGQGMIVTRNPVAPKDAFDDLLAVDGVLQGETHVVVVEGGHVGAHGKVDVQGALHVQDFDARSLIQQVGRLQIDAVDDVELTALEPVLPGGGVGDHPDFHGIEPAPVGFVVVGVPFQVRDHAGIEAHDFVGTAADPVFQGAVRLHR